MVASNEQLILKIRGIASNLPKIVDQAGELLVRNLRSNIRAKLKTNHRYPFEFKNDFQKPQTIQYQAPEKMVIIDNPAAKSLQVS